MSILESQIKDKLLPGMYIPKEFSLLFKWIEDNGFYRDNNRVRVGFLCPEDLIWDLQEGEDDEWYERQGGTNIGFIPIGNEDLKYWFGHNKYGVLSRLCVFAKTGTEGSMAAFWLDDNGQQKIVHLGSGSGSTLVCVLAEEPIDFLRLLAIGYDEICCNEEFNETPNHAAKENGMFTHPNIQYQNWVKSTFNTTIPSKANSIVEHPSEMGDKSSKDKFWQWVEINT